ncbi:uncharacterized protein LOC132724624 [Ruditapes philippinarum]|uniref:uncharacterized protein LOC132724624 n=1 Tax=Ruditapes philippinarum TaxID=129788 RepID=UPI00295B6C8D|nr:uncharacterized protein LOC132724624 [Ruditapes philippinarum]
MGKTRAEIQREYRERKKAKLGEEFMKKERERVRNYYVPASELSNKKRKERNEKMKIKNRRARAKAKELLERLQIRESSDDGPSDSGYGSVNEPGPSLNEPMIVSLPAIRVAARANGAKKKKARALARAYHSIRVLQKKKIDLERKLKTKSKQVERMKKKIILKNKIPKTPECTQKAVATTPRSKTKHEIEQLQLTPKRKRFVAKKLLLTNVLLAEIKKTKESSSKKKRRVIHNVVAGKITKKYRCMRIVSEETGLSRTALLKCKSKCIVVQREQRKSISKKQAY